MDELDQLRLIIDALYAGLATEPYHVFLGVAETCAGDDLRAAFHARAEMLHPDRFHVDGDPELRARVYAVYKRITEAYRVLGDPDTRRQYEEQRKEGAIRFERRERPGAPAKRPEDLLSPGAKKYWGLVLEAERRGDTKGAKLNLQLALQMDPNSDLLKAKMETYK